MTPKPKPMTFTRQMVPLIMADLKTQTRRIMRVQPHFDGLVLRRDDKWIYFDRNRKEIKPPHQPGDIVYVAEGYEIVDTSHAQGPQTVVVRYGDQPKEFHIALTNQEWQKFLDRKGSPYKKLAGRHMYGSLARNWLEILDVKAGRIQDISDEDAIAEGIEQDENGRWLNYLWPNKNQEYQFPTYDNPILSFASLWTLIHGPDAWDRNDWCWAYKFKRCEKPRED